ncbi:MAG: PqiC family protein [Verrucomicrobiota bacterium]
MRLSRSLFVTTLLLACFAAWGCLRPKRAPDPSKSYVLSSLPPEAAAGLEGTHDLGLGIAQVEIPAYLRDLRLVMRKGSSEVHYLENHRWAERLDRGVQRVVGANLATLLGTGGVALSAWRRQAVAAELYLAIHRFEYDESGHVTVEVRWQVTTPGAERALLTRHSRFSRPVSPGPHRLDHSVSEMSQAIADLSREIAMALPKALATAAAPGAAPQPQ